MICKVKFNRFVILLFLLSCFTGVSGAEASRLTISLNGEWELEASRKKPESWHHTIAVPGLVDMAKPYLKWKSQKSFWYRKTFTLTPDQARACAFVRVEQSKYGTEAWLNGTHIGSYLGCYTSHNYKAARAINYNGENTLIIRVGTRETLPKIGAVGYGYEKKFFVPGIWGDVSLILMDNPFIKRVQMIPHIDIGVAEARITLKNLEDIERKIVLSSKVIEKKSGKSASDEINTTCILSAKEEKTVIVNLPISNMQLWSSGYPFLYQQIVSVKAKDKEADRLVTTFGMREFKIVGSDFYLNGRRVFLRGSNIAFHRFLSDPDRKGLPWNEAWIKKILIDIPKAHNFNFFRFHIGHAYNKWYDIADEYGIMLQDEWAFWVITGTGRQIKKEFTQWIYDNCNHPSIVIWDAMNEPHDAGEISRKVIRDKIIPAMKKIDPTRPWECGLNHNIDFDSWHPVDFSEDHPYIYSMGPVLNKDDFGYARSLDEVESSSEPTILNEFVWFWLDKNGNPSSLMGDVLPRWLGMNSTKKERLEYQARLASDLCELFRRMDVDGIAPFVYLSNGDGCTANWFTGDIADPGVKPIMAALKDVFSPFGVSIELWDRHFLPSEKRNINVYLFNDTHQPKSGTLDCKITGEDGLDVFFEKSLEVTVPAHGRQVEKIEWVMPKKIGTCYLKAELREKSKLSALSKKIAHIYEPVMPENLTRRKIMVYDPDGEIFDYLKSVGLKVKEYKGSKLSRQDVLILGEGALLDEAYAGRMEEIDSFVKKGGGLIVIEPSYGITGYTKKKYSFLPGLTIAMNTRKDADNGGYDSYCFGEDMSFSLWDRIDQEHLKMFNGGWGGEMISQCDVEPMCPKLVLAKSGLNLKYSNVFETVWGNGVIVVSRIQIRGRLTNESVKENGLYSRRVDPVARQYLLNLLSTYSDVNECLERIEKVLPTYIKNVTASSIQDNDMEVSADKAVDGNTGTRWSSQSREDPQWIMLDFEECKGFEKVVLNWESAYAVEYEVQISDDAQNWKTIYAELRGNGGKDIIDVGSQKARYLRIFGKKRCNEDWGYSLWEIGVH